MSAIGLDNDASGAVIDLLDTTESVLIELQDAAERYETITTQIDNTGHDAVVETADAYRRATGLLDKYIDSATGTGDFQAYVEFQNKFLGCVEELPDELPAREAFETAADRLDSRRLSEGDFASAREDLAPAKKYIEQLESYNQITEEIKTARRNVTLHRRKINDAIDMHNEALSFADVDFDSPVEQLLDPIKAYNDQLRSEFNEFITTASVAAVIDFLEYADLFPLVAFQSPPPDLRRFARESPDANESIPTVLEFASYSGSKLDHYATDPALLQTTVAVHQTFLERLDADPLIIERPPPTAGTLRQFSGEAISILGRFASEETIAHLRAIRDQSYEDSYDRLRTALRAQTDLSANERERLRTGTMADERDMLIEARDRLTEALAETQSHIE
ncbi:hypothetical protein [Haloquadratum walsbyi]|jgi:hypothetical protein|uniref:Uncharacterized protein n=1 Tax=Haloquadratum walsbyi J07HQW2 TaxID=1238425 RepID=U1MZL3_9EURY|nr:hypothetical protein [Haloquadratum walsbyi]ERG95949.1 MAG: hypothetical protein J07HQW2_02410 [Haloquadratum walsbyi J07HQW2]